MKNHNRQTDEQHLLWLQWRDEGVSFAEIGRRFDVKYQSVQAQIQRIERDLAASEEVSDVV